MRRLAIFGIAVLAAPAMDAAVAQAPRLRVGTAIEIGADHEFTYISQAALGPRTLLAVSQPQDNSVLLFDLSRAGAPVATMGRRGAGPGEFSSLGMMGWIGDHLWVVNGDRPKVETFDSSGRLVSSRVLEAPTSHPPYYMFSSPAAILRDSAVVYYPAMIGSPQGRPAGKVEPSFPILLLRHGTSVPDTIVQLDLNKSMLSMRSDLAGGTAGIVAFQPYGNLDYLKTGADGNRVLMVLQSAAAGGEGRVLVSAVSPAGATIFRRLLPQRSLPLLDAQWDSVVTEHVKEYTGDIWSTASRARAALEQSLIRPPFQPLVSGAVLGADGTAWLRLTTQRSGMATWRVLSPTGADVGTVELPANFRLLDASRLRLIGSRRDAVGVDHLLMLPVSR